MTPAIAPLAPTAGSDDPEVATMKAMLAKKPDSR